MPRPRRFRLPFIRHPRDASHEFDDASYDGGMSGGASAKHVIVGVAVLIVVIALLRLVF